jgi:hypothetical protein
MKPKILFILFVPVLLVLLNTQCSDDEGITYSVSDVSSRITGFSNEKTGAGAQLTVNGSQLQDVQRVFVGNEVILSRNFVSQTESSLTFNVPTAVSLGVNNVLIVFSGSGRAFKEIEVIPLQAVSSFTPTSASAGEKVTMHGVNFNLVTGVKLGDLEGTIITQSATMLQFTTPAGFNTTGKITLVGTAGNSNSAADLVACAGSSAIDCKPALIPNGDLEEGTGDTFVGWNQQNGGQFMTETTDPTKVFRGSRALEVIRNASLLDGQWRLQLGATAVPTDIGASYTVYVWVKATLPGGSMRVSTDPSAVYTADQLVPTTWTRLAFTFTANIASTRVILDMNGNNTVPSVFYVDDIKLVKN